MKRIHDLLMIAQNTYLRRTKSEKKLILLIKKQFNTIEVSTKMKTMQLQLIMNVVFLSKGRIDQALNQISRLQMPFLVIMFYFAVLFLNDIYYF